MKKQFVIVWLIWMLVPALVFAANPWAERYAKQAEEALPAELPAVADAISSSRHEAGISSTISAEEVARSVSQSLQEEGAGEHIEATLIHHSRGEAFLTYRTPVTYEISNLHYNARELSWNAMLYPYDGQKPLSPVKLEGTYDEMVKVPVMTRRIHRDEVITAQDIKWREIEASRLRADTALQSEQIVGMAPRRTISPNRSVRLAELVKPAVIRKNEQVTLQFRSGTMEIKTLGEAMEDGAEGEIIRIRNKDSHQPIQARIIAAGLAEAMPLGVLAQAEGNY